MKQNAYSKQPMAISQIEHPMLINRPSYKLAITLPK